MQKEKGTCPICKGQGKVDKPKQDVAARKRRKKEIATTLRLEGYTIREIAALMGYKSPSTVDYILNQ